MSSSTMSSLSRAFTTKRNKNAENHHNNNTLSSLLQRSATTKTSPTAGGARLKISAPVELISTTNILSYSAPDIHTGAGAGADASPSSGTRSRSCSSSSDSDSAAQSPKSVSTGATTPDTSSMHSSPSSPKPNHLSCYFGTPSPTSAASEEPPKIPQRVPSHTKKSAEALARKRSMSRGSSHNSLSSRRSSLKAYNSCSNIHSLTASSSVNTISSVDTSSAPHPFGPELAKVSELAEEFGIPPQKMQAFDAEENEVLSRGLLKFSALDYWNEISSLYRETFSDTKLAMRPMWI